MTHKTLLTCHQIIGQLPAKDAKQAATLAEILGELENELEKSKKTEQTIVMRPTEVVPPIEGSEPA